ncbi:sugar phosphate isomerase/epimerase family protein [Celerinatantimonas sp. MCCC 1A17872]|uniref:sugar phosphate isomerase/epimerase family protein n=1 Tax=Celerinatantimonas sp. MCCC 1A17872 TaxID=3177514 RepID=UPI0038C2CC8E
MKRALHGAAVRHCNVTTQVRIAKECGFDALEVLPEHLFRYCEHGGSYEKLLNLCKQNGIEVSCINALNTMGFPNQDKELALLAHKFSNAAKQLECPVVQIMALNEIDEYDVETRKEILTHNASIIGDVGLEYGVKFQIEVVAFTSFGSLAQGLEIIDRAGRSNIGMVIDFWHLYASGTKPEEVAAMNKELIYGVHFCDGRKPYKNEKWDELIQRDYRVGEGDIPVQEWVDAVKATGYDGVWAPEQLSQTHWEDDLMQTGKENYQSLLDYGV